MAPPAPPQPTGWCACGYQLLEGQDCPECGRAWTLAHRSPPRWAAATPGRQLLTALGIGLGSTLAGVGWYALAFTFDLHGCSGLHFVLLWTVTGLLALSLLAGFLAAYLTGPERGLLKTLLSSPALYLVALFLAWSAVAGADPNNPASFAVGIVYILGCSGLPPFLLTRLTFWLTSRTRQTGSLGDLVYGTRIR